MNKMRTMRSSFSIRILMAAVITIAAGAALLVRNDQAAAASQPINLTFSGSGGNQTWLQGEVVCDECLPDILHSGSGSWGIGGTVELDGQAKWNPGPANTNLQYSAGNLRQGRTLDLVDTLTPQAGTVTINYSVPIEFGIFNTPGSGGSCGNVTDCNALGWAPNSGETTSTTITESDTIPCTMPLPGDSPVACTKSFEIKIFDGDLFSIIGAKITLPITETVNVTGSGVASVRVAAISGGPAITNNNLNFAGTSPSSVSDPIFISCSQPVGADLLYSMTQNGYTADPMTWDGSVGLKIEATALGFSIPVVNTTLVTLSGFGLGPVPMTAPDQQVDLGAVQANNVPPVITSVGGPYSGDEGSPIQFNGSATSVCGTPTLRWDFSDGGVAFGPNPQHTFTDGTVTYSGMLTATDATGLTSTATFSVQVNNVNPTVSAGPAKTSPWGLPVSFHANGADAGAIDNLSLLYTWDFNDPNSLIGASGQDVSHVYSAPGVYNAEVTVHDKDGGTGTATVQVTVNARGATLSYTGVTTSDVTDPATLKATLIDDQGAPVVGRIVSFYADGSATAFASAATDGSGVASVAFPFPNGSVGTHTIVAQFAGDSMYTLSQFTVSFSVAKDGTILAYTGALSANPSKAVSLTAKLTDDMGRALAGKTVTFTLGTQGCTGTTNSVGVVSCTIAKLNQKPGNYFLTASFAGDADYLASSANLAFTIGK